MTCSKLLVAVSTALSGALLIQTNLFGQTSSSGDSILTQIMQVDSEPSLPPPIEGEPAIDTSGTIQMPAKKALPRPASKVTSKTSRPASKPKRKRPVKAPNPMAPPDVETIWKPIEPAPSGSSQFQVPFPEDNGDLDIWGQTTTLSETIAVHQLGIQGIFNYFGNGIGLEYIHPQNSWFDWGIYASSTKVELSQSKIPTIQEFLNGKLGNLKFFTRFFYSRKLYLGTGLSISNYAGTYGWRGDNVRDSKISTRFNSQFASADVFIGSEWMLWKALYLGIDGVGSGTILTGSTKYDDNEDLDILTKVLTGSTINNRVQHEISAQLNLYYGILRLGYKF